MKKIIKAIKEECARMHCACHCHPKNNMFGIRHSCGDNVCQCWPNCFYCKAPNYYIDGITGKRLYAEDLARLASQIVQNENKTKTH